MRSFESAGAARAGRRGGAMLSGDARERRTPRKFKRTAASCEHFAAAPRHASRQTRAAAPDAAAQGANLNASTGVQRNTPAAPAEPAAPAQKPKKPAVKHTSNPEHEGGGETPDEGVIAIHTDHSNFTINSGGQLPQQAGDYIYFQHGGKPYVIEDPEIIAKAQALLAPMKELGEQQKMLGHQQAMLGAQQRMLAAQSRVFKTVEDVRRQLEPIIEQAIREGKGKLLIN